MEEKESAAVIQGAMKSAAVRQSDIETADK